MATLTSPSTQQLSSVRGDVRLCGSIPREEMDAVSLTKCAPLGSRTSSDLGSSTHSTESNGSSDAWVTRDSSTHHTIEDTNSVAVLCSQLSIMQRVETQNAQALQSQCQRRYTPTFEPPSWAVPARGEARLEVSME